MKSFIICSVGALILCLCHPVMLNAQSKIDSKNMEVTYPETKKIDHVDVYHGVEVADPYRWLEDDMSEETAAWVEEENEVTFGYLDKIPFREELKDRLRQLMDYERMSQPKVEGDYTYYSKNDGLQNHSVYYRVPNSDPGAEPEIFLDPNTFAEDGTIALRGLSFTKDGSLSAHQITEGGSDWRKVIVMDAIQKTVIEDTIVDVKFSGISWRGNHGFYYSSYDNPENSEGSELSTKTQHHKLYYHKLGTEQKDDVLVFGGENQPNRYIGGGVTEDQNYLIVTAAQNTSGNQVYIMDLTKPGSDFIQISDDYNSRLSPLVNVGTKFLFSTNIDAPNYRIIAIDLNAPASKNWKDVIPETKNVLTAGSAGGKIFAEYLVDAKSVVKQYDIEGNFDLEIKLPGLGSASGFNGKATDKEIYYSFSSFTFPTTIYRYTIKTGKSELYRLPDVDFDPNDYVTSQIFYNSKDGTKIPMFIVYKKGVKRNGKNPTYLYAYGGFNISLTPRFSPTRLAWLENGGIYAQPNLRGGGEYGEEWHVAGTQMQKQNVFDDFIAAAEYLIDKDYTSSEFLTIAGGSNGGLLVGATMIQRPDLMQVALPAVGVMDMLRYHTFTAGAGWSYDYGTSEDSPEMFEYLRAYSPVHALVPGTSYPATLVTTADHDDRVVPAHSFKFAARLQECNVGANPQLIRIQTNAGHGSVSTEQRIALIADLYAFAWYNMGITPQFGEKVKD